MSAITVIVQNDAAYTVENNILNKALMIIQGNIFVGHSCIPIIVSRACFKLRRFV